MKLVIEDDEGRKTVVPVVREEMTIGRQEGNTIRLTERNVSRRHARLLKQNSDVLIEDLGSYTGIRVNGERIKGQVPVREGDLIQIGDYDLALQSDNPTAPPPSIAPVSGSTNHDGDTLRSLSKTESPTVPTLPIIQAVGGHAGNGALGADARNHSTAVISMDSIEAQRPRQVISLEAHQAPRLEVLSTEFAGREFALIRTEIRIGRAEDNDISIDHRSLSRTHCKIVREESGEWRVLDMQSANGIKVNGEQYSQSALKYGDELELGHVRVRFLAPHEEGSVQLSKTFVGEMGKGPKVSQAPMFAAAVTVALLILGAGYMYVSRSGKNAPPEPKTLTTPQPPTGLSPAQVDELLRKSSLAAEAGDFDSAKEYLGKCTVGDAPCPGAEKMLTDLNAALPFNAAYDRIDQLIDSGETEKAKTLLDSTGATPLLQKRFDDLSARVGKLVDEKNSKKAPGTSVVPQPKPATAEQDPAATFVDKGKAQRDAGKFKEAAQVLAACVRVHPGDEDCLYELGLTYNKWFADACNGDYSCTQWDECLKAWRQYINVGNPSTKRYKKVSDYLGKASGAK